MIVAGELLPGQRVIERDMAERLGTSRGPVRDAIRTLTHEGLVDVRPYAGACVSVISRDEVDEIVAIRRQVEYFGVAGAVLHASSEDIATLRTLAARLEMACRQGDIYELVNADLQFHLAICSASKHPTLVVVLRTLLPRLMCLFYPTGMTGRDVDSYMSTHTAILDSIEQRNLEASLSAIDQHMDDFYTELDVRIVHTTRSVTETLSHYPIGRPIRVERRLGGA
jgi:DNA-binding GntR family transcriptional regulator